MLVPSSRSAPLFLTICSSTHSAPPEKGVTLKRVVPWQRPPPHLGPSSWRSEADNGRTKGTAERRAVKLQIDLFQGTARILSHACPCALCMMLQHVRTDVKCGSV